MPGLTYASFSQITWFMMLAVAIRVGGDVPSVKQAAVPKEAAVFRDWSRLFFVAWPKTKPARQ